MFYSTVFVSLADIEDTMGVQGNELELIALVRNCPFLYDKNVPDFKESDKKYEAWNAIAEVMKATGISV